MKQLNQVIEKYRLKTGFYGSDDSIGNNGVFIIPYKNIKLFCIVSDQEGWDHISLHVECVKKKRTPFWDEMCFIKNLFWREDETVIEYHPKKTEYINCHPYTLHLWKKHNVDYELPPSEMV